MSNYSSLKQLTDEIDVLLSRNITSSDSDFRKWRLRAERFLSKCYGDSSKEYKDFHKTHFFPLVFVSGTTEQEDLMDKIEACQNGLNITKDAFNVYLEEFEEDSEWNCQEMCSRRIPKILDSQISGSVRSELL